MCSRVIFRGAAIGHAAEKIMQRSWTSSLKNPSLQKLIEQVRQHTCRIPTASNPLASQRIIQLSLDSGKIETAQRKVLASPCRDVSPLGNMDLRPFIRKESVSNEGREKEFPHYNGIPAQIDSPNAGRILVN